MSERSHSTVHLTRIYTRTGDDGTTALGDMSRAAKTSVRVAAYGDVDEANCALGMVLALGELPEPLRNLLQLIQNDLFDVGADLATPIVADPKWQTLRIEPSYIDRLEQACDLHNESLAPLNSFVLPGGSPASALLQVARVVTRRAERAVWALLDQEPDATNPLTATYLNRLSDLLFILARVANDPSSGTPGASGDVTWVPQANRPS